MACGRRIRPGRLETTLFDIATPWASIDATLAACLAYLMQEHDLRQGGLPEVGTQSGLSEILVGKRELHLRQVKPLSDRFRVAMEVFAG